MQGIWSTGLKQCEVITISVPFFPVHLAEVLFGRLELVLGHSIENRHWLPAAAAEVSLAVLFAADGFAVAVVSGVVDTLEFAEQVSAVEVVASQKHDEQLLSLSNYA